MQKEFYSNGKLLLSGEYAILDGALGLAVPTKYGQSLTVKSIEKPILLWKSLGHEGNLWFEAEFTIDNFTINNATDSEVAHTLQALLMEAKKQNRNFLSGDTGFRAESHLTFPRNWGLGSSSTLINNIAQWAKIDAYHLLWNAFGGSGYDIACAQHDYPITYALKDRRPIAKTAHFNPTFKDSLFFVYLNQKQSSKEAIEAYRKQSFDKTKLVQDISLLTQKMIAVNSLDVFQKLLEEHEALLSKVLGIKPVQKKLFPDYPGTIKSLGAWGGDFIWVTGGEKTKEYFISKGFETVISYSEMVF
ncbi:GYDIA family GHMP kinase [Flagellimonas sp.]|uniref:GYDIA family GHMP kinase n=1 Tax=Flagellimonas sp. TaxID=2058762 RepID=UPI003F4A3018